MPDSRQPWWRRIFASNSKRAIGKDGDTCDSREGNRQPTPKEDKQIARRVMSEGDLPHAAFHVGAALFANPNDSEAMEILQQLLSKTRDPLSLAPLRDENWIGTVALRALILQKISRNAEAVGLFAQILAKPEGARYWKWAIASLRTPGVAKQVKPLEGGIILAAVISLFAGDSLRADARAEIAPAVEASDLLFAAHPENQMLLPIHSGLVRKAGRLDEALHLAERAWAAEQSYGSAIALAIACKVKGDIDGAVAGYREAMRFESNGANRCVDIAAALFGAGRYSEALTWTQNALKQEPNHPRALMYAMLARARIEPDERRMDEVRQFIRDSGGRGEADFMAHLEPFVDYLPAVQEATVNSARQFLQKRGSKPGKINRLYISSVESPSSRMAVEMALGVERGSIPMEVGKIQKPDPRVPKRKVKYVLWNYDGTDPSPALPPPPLNIVDEISQLARQPYNIDSWSTKAAEIAHRIGPGQLESVLAVMVHPTTPPENEDAWVWISHLQVAAALVAAHIDSGWENSLRREALMSLVLGPDDWTTVAGMVAMTQVAREPGDREAAEEGYRILVDMANSIARPGYCCWESARLHCILRHPMCDDSARKTAHQQLDEIEDQS